MSGQIENGAGAGTVKAGSSSAASASASTSASTSKPSVTSPTKATDVKKAEEKQEAPAASRLSYDEDEDEDGIDPRYAIDSYQAGSSSRAAQSLSSNAGSTGGGSGGNARGDVLFDANQPGNAFGSQGGRQGSGSGSLGQPPKDQRSYQSPLPAWGAAALNRNAAGQAPSSQLGSSGGILPDHHSYSTSQGWSISNLCMAAWAFPPFTSVAILIWETENDLARFHAYQSGICGVALILLLWVLRSWFGWYTLSIIVGMGALGWFWVCGSAAATNAPMLERVPYVAHAGPLAEQWVGDE